MDAKQKKEIEDIVRVEIRDQLKTELFTARKLTDTPTDALSVVNRKYVNMNGATASRPTGSILGQQYFDTSVGKPIYWSGSTWVDATGGAV